MGRVFDKEAFIAKPEKIIFKVNEIELDKERELDFWRPNIFWVLCLGIFEENLTLWYMY